MAIAAVCCVSLAGPVLAAEAVSEHSESHSMQVETVPMAPPGTVPAPTRVYEHQRRVRVEHCRTTHHHSARGHREGADDEFGRDAGKDLSGDAALHMRASKKEASHI